MNMCDYSHYCIVCGPASKSENEDISYHVFPKNKEEDWLNVFGLTSNNIKFKIQSARLCSRHFTSDDFSCLGNGRKRFRKKNAVPTVFFVDEVSFQKRKTQLCEFVDPSGTAKSDSINENTNDEPKKKYADFAKTCLICRRQKGLTLSYFSFPNGSIREAWLDACQTSEPIPKNALLCSRHFEPHHYANPPQARGRTTLKKNAIPTKFLPKYTNCSNECSKRHDAEACKIQKIPKDSSTRIEDTGALEIEQYLEDTSVQIDRSSGAPETEQSLEHISVQPDHASEAPEIKQNAENSTNKIDDGEDWDLKKLQQDFSMQIVEVSTIGSCEKFETAVPRASTPIHEYIAAPLIQGQGHDKHSRFDHSYFNRTTSSSIPRRNHKPRYPGDIEVSQIKTLSSARESILFMNRVVKQQRCEIRNLRRQVHRRNMKITNLLDAMNILKKIKCSNG